MKVKELREEADEVFGQGAADGFIRELAEECGLTERTIYGRFEGKFVTPSARLQWASSIWHLEELPAKGMKKLRVADLQIPYMLQMSEFIPENILSDAKLGKNDSFDDIKDKLAKAMEVAFDQAEQNTQYNRTGRTLDLSPYRKSSTWREESVHFLQVEPEGMDPIEARGKDFHITSSWKEFECYSPNSDLAQMDPSYTKYAQKSPQAARLLYKILKADPKALEGISWSQFGDWMTKNKIAYATHFSVWH